MPLPRLRVPLLLCALIGASLTSFADTLNPRVEPASPESTRILPIAGDGFSGSSVNVIAGLQHTLFTHRSTQYAAFYAADGTLVLARRAIGSDTWETRRTPYTGKVADAHNSASLVVDGAGYLHVAWDHHGNGLNYARSVEPGSLELGPRQRMVGRDESRVTYPSFIRLRDGDLLAFYRDGASGQGNLVLNRYDVETQKWSRVQDKVLDGEGQRSAYPSFYYDRRGTLHLAWVWRESPDVATNHDIAYARSTDGGKKWTTIDGKPLQLPITQASADYAVRIPQGRSLMNPPAVSADSQSNPLLVNYWAPEGSDVPQYHLVRFDGQGWRTSQITQRTQPFTLSGTNTKRPPLSRAVVVVERPWRRPVMAYVAFRDDERDGRAVIASSTNIETEQPIWKISDLTATSLGAWEPSFDPEQWLRMRQLHLLVQPVTQRDGNDQQAADVEPTPVANLIWSPFLAELADNRASKEHEALPIPAAGELERPLVPAEILPILERVTEWQFAFDYQRDPRGWEIAPFYIGALEAARYTASERIEGELQRRFEKMGWKPAPRPYHADDYAVIQAYAELGRRMDEPATMKPSLAYLDNIIENPSPALLEWGTPHVDDRWSWCDALFMGPASLLDAYLLTGDERYLEFANREWWATTDFLFSPVDGFYARDQSYLDVREPNGQNIYWSRGNGWVAAGLARVLARFPKDHQDYPRYVALYQRMMIAVLAAQQPDGLWRPGLLAPDSHQAREVSGSAFYTFALAWGVNHGLLDREATLPAIRRAWNAMTACVREDGKVEHIQPIGAAPEGFDPSHTDAFGVGAFLLAGSEIYALVADEEPVSYQD
ncbi:MAG: BNR-4 repeat-containing protein [Verrucomicrobiota bacterium JB022]|nr:BNR-4 repeat-containing protein [Verrucomicrobiota bacterium JB022]